MTSHNWKNHSIQVQSIAAYKMLWLGIGLEVSVDGKVSGMSPERWEGLRTRAPFQISVGDAVANGYVESGSVNSVLRKKYRVVVEGDEIASGTVVARNWYMTYLFLPAALLVLVGVVRIFV